VTDNSKLFFYLDDETNSLKFPRLEVTFFGNNQLKVQDKSVRIQTIFLLNNKKEYLVSKILVRHCLTCLPHAYPEPEKLPLPLGYSVANSRIKNVFNCIANANSLS
jgi:hypothetical protein